VTIDPLGRLSADERIPGREGHMEIENVQITAECEWEPEHGLQIVYRDGSELKRVSQQDGHLTYVDAYGLPESEDRIA